MARIDALGAQNRAAVVSAAEVVDAAVAHVRHALVRHVVRVEATDDREVQIDPRLTSAALSHLLENAAQGPDPPARDILIHAEVSHDGLRVSVTITVQARIRASSIISSSASTVVERPVRLRLGPEWASRSRAGLLAAAGGRVWAENVPGAGARFSIVVPGAVRAAAVTS